MQIQSLDYDRPENEALRRARSFNDIIAVCRDLDTKLRLREQAFSKPDNLKVTDALAIIGFCVDTQDSLRLAIMSLSAYDKNARALALVIDMKERANNLRKLVTDRLDAVSFPHIKSELVSYGNLIVSLFKQYGVTRMAVAKSNEQMLCYRTNQGIADTKGFTSGPLVIKLTLKGDVVSISMPNSPYSESAGVVVHDSKDVVNYISDNLNNLNIKSLPKINFDITAFPCVYSVTKNERTLDVTMKTSATSEDIVGFIEKVLPVIRLANAETALDVLHRVTQDGYHKVVHFTLGDKTVLKPSIHKTIKRLFGV